MRAIDYINYRMEKRATAELDTQYTQLPTDFLQPIRFVITASDISTLEQASALEISKLREANNNTVGRPVNYSILDSSIEVFPAPDTTYTLELLYYEKIDPLNSGNASNWMLSNYPDAYLYGSLMHSAPFLQEDNRIQVWAALYEKAINDIKSGPIVGSGKSLNLLNNKPVVDVVAVVGGGLSGLTASLRLLEQGKRGADRKATVYGW